MDKIDPAQVIAVESSELITILVLPSGEPCIVTTVQENRVLEILEDVRDIVDARITWRSHGCP